MELLVEVFTQKTGWDRVKFLQARPAKSGSLTLLHLSHSVESLNCLVDQGIHLLNPDDYGTEAAARLRQTYPTFTFQMVRDTGLLNLYIWQNQISWWWFLPFSENSSLRTPLVELLYWFCLLEIVLENNQITLVHLATDNADYAQVLIALCQQHHIPVGQVDYPAKSILSRFKLISAFIFTFLRLSSIQILKWLTLKWLHLDTAVDYQKIGSQSSIFCTFYPTFFEPGDTANRLKEKLFGDWPDYLIQQGHEVLYAATVQRFKDVFSRRLTLRQQLGHNHIVILESLWSLNDLIRIIFDLTFVWRYWGWRQSHAQSPMLFRGIDIHPLVIKELDSDIFIKQEAAQGAGMAYAIKRLLEKLHGARCICHTFEYQPRERAISIGVRMNSQPIPVIGFDIAMFTFNHIPFFFSPESIQQPQSGSPQPHLAPLPDYLVTYGQSSYRVFSQHFLPNTVALVGPIRYAQLAQAVQAEVDSVVFRQEYEIPLDTTLLLLATPITVVEALPMMKMTLQVAAALPDLYLLVKFHPHCPLPQELAALAKEVNFLNYQVFDSNLNTLIKVSRAIVLASSSVGIEAIALNCMPIVFSRPGNLEVNPLRDFSEAAFFCRNEADLKMAINECLVEGQLYQQRQTHWPRVIESLLYRLDGGQNERLYQWLKNQKAY